MGQRAAGWWRASRLSLRGPGAEPLLAAGLLAGGVAAFLALPGLVGLALVLVAFATLACVAPGWTLCALLMSLPLHFLVRRAAGPVELSLPDALLLASAAGLVAGVYWRALLSGAHALWSPLRRALRSPYFWPGALLMVLGTLSLLLLTPRDRQGLTVGLRAYSLLVEPLAVYALVLLAVRDRRNLWTTLDAFFVGAALAALYGVLETARYAIAPTAEVGGYFRADSVFNHPNSLALYMTRALPLFAGLALALPEWTRRRKVYVGGATVMAAALLLSGSRGGWAAAAVGALLIAALLGRYRWLAPAAAAVAGGVGLLALWGQNRLRNAFARGRGSADTRERLWRAAVEEIRDSPLWGAGLGDVRWMRRYIHRSRLTETELVDAHNFILDLWTKLGVLAVVSVLWLLWSFYRLAASGMGQGGVEARAVGVGLMAAMAASVAHGTVDAFYFGLPLAVLFWAFLGMAEVLATEPGLGGSSAPGR